jgi:hypothetical protein
MKLAVLVSHDDYGDVGHPGRLEGSRAGNFDLESDEHPLPLENLLKLRLIDRPIVVDAVVNRVKVTLGRAPDIVLGVHLVHLLQDLRVHMSLVSLV